MASTRASLHEARYRACSRLLIGGHEAASTEGVFAMQRVQVSPRRGRGFAAMDGAKQREIASKGGEAASQNRAHMAAIGRKGGEAVSQNREHMAEIGRKGGEIISQNREHMAEIGRKGGEIISQKRDHMAAIGREGGIHSSQSRRRASSDPAPEARVEADEEHPEPAESVRPGVN